MFICGVLILYMHSKVQRGEVSKTAYEIECEWWWIVFMGYTPKLHAIFFDFAHIDPVHFIFLTNRQTAEKGPISLPQSPILPFSPFSPISPISSTIKWKEAALRRLAPCIMSTVLWRSPLDWNNGRLGQCVNSNQITCVYLKKLFLPFHDFAPGKSNSNLIWCDVIIMVPIMLLQK